MSEDERIKLLTIIENFENLRLKHCPDLHLDYVRLF